MPLADAGKFVWKGGASSYIFTKDFSRIFEVAIDPQQDVDMASDGTLRVYESTKIKHTVELQFEEVLATQRNQLATIWKGNTVLDFYIKQTDATKLGSFKWVGDFNFTFSERGMIYKNLYQGRITLRET
jgi:hypothetical protein